MRKTHMLPVTKQCSVMSGGSEEQKHYRELTTFFTFLRKYPDSLLRLNGLLWDSGL